MATATMPDVQYEVPHTVDHEDDTARKKTPETQAQGTRLQLVKMPSVVFFPWG
jgi:hypothetical protein